MFTSTQYVKNSCWKCHYLVLQLLPILLPTPVVPVTLVWWVPTRSLWPHWDTASSLWIRYLSLLLLLLLNKFPYSCLIWGSKLTSSSGCNRATFYRQRTVLLPPLCTSCTLFYSVGGFCTWVDSGDVNFLSPSPLSVSPPPPRWNLKAKSGDCWEMNFRKRCHSLASRCLPNP